MSKDKPIVLWIDDSMVDMGIADHLIYSISDTVEFDIVLLGDTDEAVEFALENHDRIFMFIQDSFRREGTIIPAWKNMRPMVGPKIGGNSHQGDFYTYIIDAFAPTASAVFAGFSYSSDDRVLINEWSNIDPRVVWADKMGLTIRGLGSKKDEEPDLVRIGRAQLQRWKNAINNSQLSADGQLIKPLAEELAVVCGSRPSYLDKLTPRQFEELIAALFRNHGFKVELTSQTQDGGYDIVAASHSKLGSEVALIEVKHFAPNRPVGVGLVRALYGVKHLQNADKVMLVTSSYVSDYAKKEFSRVIPWELEFTERSKVLEWCRSYLSEILKTSEKNLS